MALPKTKFEIHELAHVFAQAPEYDVALLVDWSHPNEFHYWAFIRPGMTIHEKVTAINWARKHLEHMFQVGPLIASRDAAWAQQDEGRWRLWGRTVDLSVLTELDDPIVAQAAEPSRDGTPPQTPDAP